MYVKDNINFFKYTLCHNYKLTNRIKKKIKKIYCPISSFSIPFISSSPPASVSYTFSLSSSSNQSRPTIKPVLVPQSNQSRPTIKPVSSHNQTSPRPTIKPVLVPRSNQSRPTIKPVSSHDQTSVVPQSNQSRPTIKPVSSHNQTSLVPHRDRCSSVRHTLNISKFARHIVRYWRYTTKHQNSETER